MFGSRILDAMFRFSACPAPPASVYIQSRGPRVSFCVLASAKAREVPTTTKLVRVAKLTKLVVQTSHVRSPCSAHNIVSNGRKKNTLEGATDHQGYLGVTDSIVRDSPDTRGRGSSADRLHLEPRSLVGCRTG